jgi:hypothetical protein
MRFFAATSILPYQGGVGKPSAIPSDRSGTIIGQGGCTMLDFPKTANAVRALAEELVSFLKNEIRDTKTQFEWTYQNIRLLDRYYRNQGLACSFTGSPDGPEFLWDFIGYVKEQGNLITVESEWETGHEDIAYDFEKLLYGRSPLKLMMCRLDTKFYGEAEKEAERIRSILEEHLKSNCKQYSSGEIFIIYCVCWADKNGNNQDFAYALQIEGEPNHKNVGGDQHFQRL